MVELTLPDGRADALFEIDGALMVSQGQRVGRLIEGRVEWVGKVPPGGAAGPSVVSSVMGRWPDEVDAVYTSSTGRAPMPTFFPINGKGMSHTFAPGGGAGWVTGTAKLGASTLLAGWSSAEGYELITVRGPAVSRKPKTPAEAGCKAGEIAPSDADRPTTPAVAPSAIFATPGGTLLTIGRLCEKRGPVAEVWDGPGASRIVDLSPWMKELAYFPKILRGVGEEAWILNDGKGGELLRFAGGAFTAAPRLDKPVKNAFVSPKGQLHASDGATIWRLDGARWLAVAKVDWPTTFRTMAIDHDGALWAGQGGVYRLRETPATPMSDCKTPFVHLYDVSPKNEENATFPATQKALSTFPGVSELSLVEFREPTVRRLGVVVTSAAQGEAVVAHVVANMVDEHPRLVCYEPKKPRKIVIKGRAR